jgi:hypothetical protein
MIEKLLEYPKLEKEFMNFEEKYIELMNQIEALKRDNIFLSSNTRMRDHEFF